MGMIGYRGTLRRRSLKNAKEGDQLDLGMRGLVETGDRE